METFFIWTLTLKDKAVDILYFFLIVNNAHEKTKTSINWLLQTSIDCVTTARYTLILCAINLSYS